MGMRCIYRTNHLHLATTGLPHSDSSPPIRQKRRKLRVRNSSKRKLTKPFWGRERAWRCKGPRGGERYRRGPARPALGRRGLTQSTSPSFHTSFAALRLRGPFQAQLEHHVAIRSVIVSPTKQHWVRISFPILESDSLALQVPPCVWHAIDAPIKRKNL